MARRTKKKETTINNRNVTEGRETLETEQMPKKSGVRTFFGVVRTIITVVLMLAAFAMMVFTIVSVTTFDRNDRDLFGYKAFIVKSDSMSATDFSAGDLVLIEEVDPATLQVGDIIAFQSEDPNSFGETFTHKIRALTTDENGNPAFITYGTTTDTDDEYPVTYSQVLGKYVKAIPKVGTFFSFLKTVPGYLLCIFLPFMLLILFQGINSMRLFKQYKAEQMAEIEAQRQKEMEAMAAEREALAAEREESRRMMMEIQQMRQGNMPSSRTRMETTKVQVVLEETPIEKPKKKKKPNLEDMTEEERKRYLARKKKREELKASMTEEEWQEYLQRRRERKKQSETYK